MEISTIVLDICTKGNSEPYKYCGGNNFARESYNKYKNEMKFISLNDKKIIPLSKLITSCMNKKEMRKNLLNFINNTKNKKNIIIACYTASSSILDILINNNFILNNIKIFEPIIPTCNYIIEKKYKNILILSTSFTRRVRWHARILNLNVKYISFEYLHQDIENNNINNINTQLSKLSKHKDFISICDCVVLGCTHYNIIKKDILHHLNKYNFKGEVINSNYVLYNYFSKNNK